MIIDMHAHVGDMRSPRNLDREVITIESLMARLDEDSIDMAAVLPWPPCPEAVGFPSLFSTFPDIVSQIRATRCHPDRLIAFGNADPRWGGKSPRMDFSYLLERFVDLGCVGMGEVSANILFDDPRVVNLLRQCGDWELPLPSKAQDPEREATVSSRTWVHPTSRIS